MISDNKQLRIYNKEGKFARASVDEVIANKLNMWKNWNCSAGIRHLYIDYDKNIFICNTSSAKAISSRWEKPWKDYILAQKKKMGRSNLSTKEIDQLGEQWAEIIKDHSSFETIGYIGKIGEELFFPQNWVVCPFESCGCGADVIVSKSKNSSFENLLSVTKDGYDGQYLTKDNQIDKLNNIDSVGVEMDFPIPYQILWDLTRRCNYNCSYCWPYVHNKTDEFIPTEQVISSCRNFIFNWAHAGEIRFNFGGGEPTLHPGFLDIIKYLKEHKQWVLVTSNGSRSASYWKEAVKYLNSVNLSAHFESINKKRFLEILTIILDRHDSYDDDHWVEVKLMTPPGRLNEALEFQEQIKEMNRLNKPGANNRTKGICSLVPIRGLEDSGKMVEYTEEELCHFKQQ